MKKTKTIITLTIIISTILIPLTPKLYAYIFTPHINPETLPEPSTPPVANALTQALDQLAAQNWNQLAQQASSIEQIPVVQGGYLLTEISDLLLELAATFQQINMTILIIELLIEYGALDKAQEELENLQNLISEANETITELEEKINQVIQVFNLQPTQLKQKLNQIKNLLNNYIQKREELQQKREEILLKIEQEILVQTNLLIAANTSQAPPGSTVRIYGILTVNNTLLPNKIVAIYLFNQTYATNITAKTNITGIFETNVKLPEIYIESIAIFAAYKPVEEDAEHYVPSVSNIIEMNLTFQTPTITILNVPEKVRPSLQYTIEGTIQLNNTPLANWPINITINQNTVKTETDSQGRFEYTFKTPETPLTSTLSITITTKPQKEIGPGQTTVTILIEYIDPELEAKTPKTVIAGINFKIDGTAKTAEDPLKNATITVKIGRKTVITHTDENGTFTVKIHASPLTLTRKITVTIILTPKEPWINSQAIEKEVFIINPLIVIAPIIPILAPIIYLSKPRRKMKKILITITRPHEILRPPKKETKVKETLVREEEEIVIIHPIVDLYWKLVEKLKERIEEYPKPSQTLREYLAQIKGKLGTLALKFERFTMLTEKALYLEELTVAEEKYAEKLYKSLLKELKQ